jgi:predicted Zn finger-like uncharacterized protein
MTEIQCPSCQTRYRIDKRVLPEETPTFKCSRCGHVFNFEPRRRRSPVHATASRTARSPADETATGAPELPSNAARANPPPRSATPRDAAAGDAAAQRRMKSADATARRASAPKPVAEMPAKPASTPPWAAPSETGGFMDRPLQDRPSEADGSENLSFDFDDETPEPAAPPEIETQAGEERWEVGDPDAEADFAGADDGYEEEAATRVPKGSPAEALLQRAAAAKAVADTAEIAPDPSVAFLHKSRGVHSAGFFLGLFALVAVGFGILSLTICGAPMASAEFLSNVPAIGARFAPPVVAARLVALTGVHADYRKLRGNHSALVISGNAENVSTVSLHAVQITVGLLGGGQAPVRNQAVYCGNSLSAEMIGEMTPHEIEFFQRLDPPKNFLLAASQSTPFVLVFVDPPNAAGRFAISVTRAEPAAGDGT